MRRVKQAMAGALIGAAAALALAVGQASAAVPHTVQRGETLSGIAAANGLTTEALAAANGISPETYVIAGQTLEIPTASASSAAGSGATHTVQPGETLSGIAAANGLTTEALAAANGISPESYVIVGQTLRIPAPTSASAAAPAPGLAPIYCPCGTVYLRSDAAAAWMAMRRASLRTYGVDLYPDGPLSAYRTYDQQAYLYRLFLTGRGAPADPPGTSSHELGLAVDVATPAMRSIVDEIGARYGWGKVHGPNEWWHVDYLG